MATDCSWNSYVLENNWAEDFPGVVLITRRFSAKPAPESVLRCAVTILISATRRKLPAI